MKGKPVNRSSSGKNNMDRRRPKPANRKGKGEMAESGGKHP